MHLSDFLSRLKHKTDLSAERVSVLRQDFRGTQKAGGVRTCRAGYQHCRLLLVEDNALNAEIAQILLTDEGATVTVVTDGKQAVEIVQNNPPDTFDAVLMDVMMPVMNGIDAAKTIRSLNRPDAKTLPIIAMTANAFYEDAQKCLAAGMNAHLAKPLQIKKVKQTIAEWVKNNRSAKKDA